MGSAEGRRKCWQNFWDRGYWLGQGQGDYSESELRYQAHTVSMAFQGYFVAGYKWGREDRDGGTRRTYHQWRLAKQETK